MANIYDGKYSMTCVGRIESNGYVYDGKYSMNCIGRVESNGYVYDGKYSMNCIGRVESAPTKMGGAAYILLLR